jgi:multicomponent Na+:H+ antiporter subunit C
MNGLVAALVAGMLFANGTYLILRREPIKLIIGLSLISYGVNILLFTASTLRRGIPPIVQDKAAFAGDISQFVDPLPQALILTAIVISFGITAFLLTLIRRRNTLTESYLTNTPAEITEIANDPFGVQAHFLTGLDADPDDYEWLEDTFITGGIQTSRIDHSQEQESS